MPSRDFTKERQHFPGGWVVWYNADAVKLKWIAEHPGPPRIRPGFEKMEDAIAHCVGTHNLSLNGVTPLGALEGQRHLILQRLATRLETAPHHVVQAWDSVVGLDDKMIGVLYKISSTLVECKDLHRAEELVIKVLEQLRHTRSHVTIGFLVPTFIKAHFQSLDAHKTPEQKKKAMQYHGQLVKVGNFLVEHFGKEFVIDDLDDDRIKKFKDAYAIKFPTRTGDPVAATTLNIKGRIVNQYLNYAEQPLGWKGAYRVTVLDLPNSNPDVALNFHELSSMIIGLHFTDPFACRAYVGEVYGCLRFVQINKLTWRNLRRPFHLLRIAGDATKATSVLSQRGANGNCSAAHFA
jgi:hypothetical protein